MSSPQDKCNMPLVFRAQKRQWWTLWTGVTPRPWSNSSRDRCALCLHQHPPEGLQANTVCASSFVPDGLGTIGVPLGVQNKVWSCVRLCIALPYLGKLGHKHLPPILYHATSPLVHQHWKWRRKRKCFFNCSFNILGGEIFSLNERDELCSGMKTDLNC